MCLLYDILSVEYSPYACVVLNLEEINFNDFKSLRSLAALPASVML